MKQPPAHRPLKTLILTEKPSVARDFAHALGIRGKKEGYMEDSRYIVTWAVGHLVELSAPEDYDPRWKPWRLDTLPILPESFQYRPIPKTRKQLDVVLRLLDSGALDRVIIATDAGREGEVIARTILMAAGFAAEDRLMRFWTSQALTPEIVREGLAGLRPASAYDRLWKAGQARQIADWLVGMSCSRAATLLSRGGPSSKKAVRGKPQNDVYSVGRVQTAVLALIVDRKRAREAFVAEPFWLLRVCFTNEKGEWWGTWCRDDQRRLAAEGDAEKIREKILGRTGMVAAVSARKKRQPPPPLYALTDLQQDANQKYGLSAQATLQIAQNLYERKKCLSYPRTDARVLGSGNVALIRTLVETLTQTYPELFGGVEETLIQTSNKRVFNDGKLTDHHALIPLSPLPADAAPPEKQVYDLVLKRFAAAFHPDHAFEQTDVVTAVEGEPFQTRGRRTIRPGWKQVYANEGRTDRQKDGEEEEIAENLPPLAQGDPAEVKDSAVDRRMTQPPPEYTEALLLKDMGNPGRYVSEDALRKIFRGEVGLGTQATRAQIIETLLTRSYVVRRKKHLLATDKGCYLVDTLRRFQTAKMLASPEETARWEARLEQIARGGGSDEDFLNEIKEMVTLMIEEFKAGPKGLGPCPACGGEVISGKRDYGCANWRKADGGCRFVMDSEVAGQRISAQTVSALLSTRQAGPFSGFVSARGEMFDGMLRLVQSDGRWQVQIEVSDMSVATPPATAAVIGKCPQCGGNVIENPKSYGCDNWREADGGCRFVIWKETARKGITPQMAAELIQKGSLGPLDNFMSKKGKPFTATLKLVHEGERWEVRFDFGDDPAAEGGPPPKAIGKCPACGGDVTEGVKAYGCINWREADGGCKFVVWRTIAQKQISPAMACDLLEKGVTEMLSGFISRKGSSFSARLRLSTEGPPPPKVVFDFSEDSGR
ncbi:DNA topoisomerase 3 [Desulfococcus sp.]|uniref:DNA topoisomerase 3 n=1 Tax=Desulfococcus sp. TaxID=2025834 RepID=UPI0035937BCF